MYASFCTHLQSKLDLKLRKTGRKKKRPLQILANPVLAMRESIKSKNTRVTASEANVRG